LLASLQLRSQLSGDSSGRDLGPTQLLEKIIGQEIFMLFSKNRVGTIIGHDTVINGDVITSENIVIVRGKINGNIRIDSDSVLYLDNQAKILSLSPANSSSIRLLA